MYIYSNCVLRPVCCVYIYYIIHTMLCMWQTANELRPKVEQLLSQKVQTGTNRHTSTPLVYQTERDAMTFKPIPVRIIC